MVTFNMLINIKKMLFIIYQIWVILSKPQQILKISWTVSHLVGQVFFKWVSEWTSQMIRQLLILKENL